MLIKSKYVIDVTRRKSENAYEKITFAMIQREYDVQVFSTMTLPFSIPVLADNYLHTSRYLYRYIIEIHKLRITRFSLGNYPSSRLISRTELRHIELRFNHDDVPRCLPHRHAPAGDNRDDRRFNVPRLLPLRLAGGQTASGRRRTSLPGWSAVCQP